mmetsp:Transcript_41862/g.90735  ORF Transcript_41862/g.90735 Transcript_41862/m.90735 type:complete len:193 (-) Transcript_41862:36-614(-)
MASCAIAFSVWMRPSGDLDTRLASVIREVSEAFGAPPFAPHVTLLGNAPKGTVEEAKLATEKLAAKLAPFEVKILPDVVFHDTWNQNVLMYVEESPALLEANRQAQQTLLAREDATASFARPSGRPHSSLIYGDHPMEERPKIVSWIQDRAPWLKEGMSFTVGEIQLWAASPGFSAETVPGWYFVESFKLQS